MSPGITASSCRRSIWPAGSSSLEELGANVIHCAACVPTQTDQAQELLAGAVRNCLDANVLIVAPVGNDSGTCRCIPAVLPDTLGVGALKDDGRPFNFSNWGGNYLNGAIDGAGRTNPCAQPCMEEPIREKGTSLAAPVVTGIRRPAHEFGSCRMASRSMRVPSETHWSTRPVPAIPPSSMSLNAACGALSICRRRWKGCSRTSPVSARRATRQPFLMLKRLNRMGRQLARSAERARRDIRFRMRPRVKAQQKS